MVERQLVYFYLAYIFSASGAVLGSKVTVFYNVSQSSMCTCQLDSEAPVPCKTFYKQVLSIQVSMSVIR